jgi:Rab GDP dissociation inhibitor
MEQFFIVSDIYEPTSNGLSDNLFITKSYDSTSHFESTIDDVLEMYKTITGQDLDLTNIKIEEEENQ